jgi:hypothetical protein
MHLFWFKFKLFYIIKPPYFIGFQSPRILFPNFLEWENGCGPRVPKPVGPTLIFDWNFLKFRQGIRGGDVNLYFVLIIINDLVVWSLLWIGIKINQVDMLDSRGYNRIQIASQAIEAYLIQVKTLFLPYHTMSCMPLILISVFQFPASISSDTWNWFLSCRSSSWKSFYWCGWSSTHLLWFWNDGRNKIFHSGETASTFLCCLWA